MAPSPRRRPSTPSARTRCRTHATAAVAALALLAGVLLGTTSGPAAAATSSRLDIGAQLGAGATVSSPGGAYVLVVQGDGNVVLYGPGGPRWATGTSTAGSTLVFQTDGNLVLYTPSGRPVWASGTYGRGGQFLTVTDVGDVIMIAGSGATVWTTAATPLSAATTVGAAVASGTPLTALRYLTSPDGAVTARFDTDGRFVVRTAAGVLWSAGVGVTTGTTFLLQSDGNVVLYGPRGALWASNRYSPAPGRLVVQDDGNLVLYGASGAPEWASGSSVDRPVTPVTPTTSDRLQVGQRLAAGARLTSPGGAYTLVQQTDGNLVLYGPHGATWSTHSAGWSGVTSVLQTDGNFVVYAGSGAPLFATGSFGGAVLVLQADGNLVVYTAGGVPLWSSAGSPPPPPLFPPQTSAPPAATSRYLRDLHGTAADLTTMRSAGCTDATANPDGRRYLTFLAFGAQASSVGGGWGVQLTASTLRITDGAVVAAVRSYIDGYRACMAPYSTITIAVGTNNDGEDAGLGATGGAVWAQQVINPLAAYAASVGSVSIAAADDIEPGFNGSASQAVSWLSGYLGASSAPFVNTGSADGCPQTLGSTATCNYGWTPRVLYDLTYGSMWNRSLPLVQIYYTSMASQWANISLVGEQAAGRPIQFAGPLTEVTACAQAGSCYSMPAGTAWTTLWGKLHADPRIRVADLPYTTDLRIDW